jgi:hypothetical protein
MSFEVIGEIRRVAKRSSESVTWTNTMNQDNLSTAFAICVDNGGYPASLELHKVYPILPDADAAQDGDVRVIDESGEDYLYPARAFLPVELRTELERSLRESFARQLVRTP